MVQDTISSDHSAEDALLTINPGLEKVHEIEHSHRPIKAEVKPTEQEIKDHNRKIELNEEAHPELLVEVYRRIENKKSLEEAAIEEKKNEGGVKQEGFFDHLNDLKNTVTEKLTEVAEALHILPPHEAKDEEAKEEQKEQK